MSKVMKSLALAITLALLTVPALAQGTKISDLPAASASTAGVFPVVQAGANKKASFTANALDLLGLSYAGMRAALDLEAGTDFYSKSAADAAFQPLDGDLTSWAAVTRAAGIDTFTATPSSANLAAALTNESGTGAAIFADSPVFTTKLQTATIELGAASDTTFTRVSAGVAAVEGVTILTTATGQPLDSDLTTIAGLTATTDNFLQSKSSAWASRTPSQVTADLSAVVGDSGSGGTKGLVPAPGVGDAAAGKFLKADGTWSVPAGGGGGGGDALTANPLSQFAATTSLQFAGVISDETGSGAVVLGTAPQISTIELGNASDTTFARVSGGTASVEGQNILTAATGQPLDSDLTSWAAVTRAAGFDTFVATPSSANLAAALTNETGSGAAMFGTSPSITTDITIPNTGLHILDTNASHDLVLVPGSDLTADRNLTFTTGDAAIEMNVADAGSDQLLFWDDSANKWTALTLPSNLVISGTSLRDYETWCVAISDETTAITTGTAKASWSFPYAWNVVGVYGTLNTSSSSGTPTFDINEGGTTIISTKIVIDQSELTGGSSGYQGTAAGAAVISDASIAAFAQMTVDIDTAGTGAKGAKVCMIGYL